MNLASLAHLVVPLALAGACKRVESEPAKEPPKVVEPTKPVVETKPAVAPTAPTATAPPAEPAPAPAPPAHAEWTAGTTKVDATAIDTNHSRQVHLTAGSSTFDIPVTGGLEEALRVVDGSLVYWSRHEVPNPMEVQLNSFFAVRIAWDAKAAKPVVKKTWKCEEDLKPCVQPSWAGPAWVNPNEEEADD